MTTAVRLTEAFRGQPAGLAVVTAAGPVGLTASSVASLALDPPAVAFSLKRASSTAAAVLAAETALVHLLDADDVALAERFAAPGDRFAAVRWAPLPTGEPRLLDTGLALRCQVLSTVDVGASVLIAAQVVEVLGERRGAHLVHVDRTHRVLA
ncbi:flavin reductase family protein [Pseudonocardia sp. CA-107938]|uniref:flavin reductase family protein n=1 Tax=Pseudonocardia sp. CA-107938 TaxID=3240021 RepID=UPI003D8B9281